MNSPEIYTARAPSFFDGGLFGLVIHRFVAFWIVLLTFWDRTPLGCLLFEALGDPAYGDRWQATGFTGTAVGLFGTWMKQLFFVFITLGIYALWVGIGLEEVGRETYALRTLIERELPATSLQGASGHLNGCDGWLGPSEYRISR